MKNSLGRDIPAGEAVLCKNCKKNWHDKKYQYCFPCSLKLGLLEKIDDYEWCHLEDTIPSEAFFECGHHGLYGFQCKGCPFFVIRGSYRLKKNKG